ncbi:Condensin complex subunit [Komagataella phaffii CBS 7435]|uniref:Condensin complex subunit 1 n=1 Tax=Komagataella phaffii (strain ATCC 76273 / CBS 7435 / CECT 11047 / NRRL Y-11430 / Wegner 21-1) TaxID=981350 RepID=F2QWX5_KOMPC|nr:GQ67_03317T0 [Komagataella phaffii]AOA68424.1 GQ68_03286T0 [Komagataella phaffii GS115]CAH2449953.1 Condensin complex subunit [Komagataella phaffii CBS 7435]CCA39903.1 Condensin complex subunit [Komagataella phaffii CBS 7435]
MDFTFVVSEALTEFQATEKGQLTLEDSHSKLEEVTDALALSPEAIGRSEIFDLLKDLVLASPTLNQKQRDQIGYLICSTISSIAKNTSTLIESGEVDSFPVYKKYLELYGFLMHCHLTFLALEDHSAAVTTQKIRRATKKDVDLFKNHCLQLENALEATCTVFGVNLERLFETTPERDLFVNLFTRPVYLLMESEQRIKVTSVKLHIFKVICIGIRNHGHAPAAESSILQNLTYFLHLAVIMAELLDNLSEQYNYSQLTDEILRNVSLKEFNPNDANGPRSISLFIAKLSELNPRLVLRQMTFIAQLLDNSSHMLRCAVVEACGNIVITLAKDDISLENHQSQIETLLKLLEQRFLDQNPYVRTKAIQALLKLCELKERFSRRRYRFLKLAVRSLNDRNPLVRRNAIKLICKVILTHSFSAMHGPQLGLSVWQKRLVDIQEQINSLDGSFSSELIPTGDANNTSNTINLEQDQDFEGDITMRTIEEDSTMPTPGSSEQDADKDEHNEKEVVDYEALNKLKLTHQYYKDAIKFIKTIHRGTKLAAVILYSKNRTEVLETMDFFVLADAYGIEIAELGVKKMLHLVWIKNNNDEGTSVSSHLMECYKQLFFTTPATATPLEKATYIASNLVALTKSASASDLASLEKLLCMMYTSTENDLIDDNTIKVLWKIYQAKDNSVSIEQKHGSIIILSMLSLADNQIALRGLDQLLNIGLGGEKVEDMILARFSCVAIQRMVPQGKKIGHEKFTLERKDEIINKLVDMAVMYSEDGEWYGAAEHALNAIFIISSHPIEVGSSLLKKKIETTFGEVLQEKTRIRNLTQLLFLVGHISIKTIVYLEKCEAEFKRRKLEASSSQGKQKPDESKEVENELEMIGGTSEDDFSDAIAFIKEKELLFDENSLLAKFGPLVKEICANNLEYQNTELQRSAVLCLEKFMCVSSKFCEENLPLLITIMEKSPDPIIRSNAVLGLGDMAVCFNNLVDENTDFLYRRLHDDNIMVQRTCLMTITFLILAGQLKVKGQLATMAKCLENEDQGISDMCKLFFTELAAKDNAIYNGFIDMFSGLTNDKTLEKDAMKRIIKFLVPFIGKERHQKQLAQKLLHRLEKVETEDQWNDVAFVLQSLPLKNNEQVQEALAEGFKVVQARS